MGEKTLKKKTSEVCKSFAVIKKTFLQRTMNHLAHYNCVLNGRSYFGLIKSLRRRFAPSPPPSVILHRGWGWDERGAGESHPPNSLGTPQQWIRCENVYHSSWRVTLAKRLQSISYSLREYCACVKAVFSEKTEN